jgi:release factor glutamine methyltransferase
LDAEILLAHVLGQDRTWLYTHPQERIGREQLVRFNRLLERRAVREPVAYIVGYKAFFGLEFQVNRHVLIPRPETELLVETALEIVSDKQPMIQSEQQSQINQSEIRNPKSEIKIVDVGAGSGCIAIALATKLPGAKMFAIDASVEALSLARHNARRHNVRDRVIFLLSDLLHALDQPVDLIVSNPPYVSRSELGEVSPEISQYEPRLALDGGADGLEVIRQLLAQAKEKLRPGGAVLVEIGAAQGQSVAKLARNYFPGANILVKKDLAGLDRLLVISLGPSR